VVAVFNHGKHGIHGKESSHGYALLPCVRSVRWLLSLTTENTEYTEGNRRTVMPYFRVFGVFSGCCFFNHGQHGTHGKESSHGYALLPCVRSVRWLLVFLTTENTEHTEGNRRTVMPCFRVFGVFSGCLFSELEDPIGSRIVRPVLARVATPHVDPFLVPLHPGSNACGTEPQRQTTPSARREVRFGSMEQQIAMDRDLSGFEHIVDDLAVLLGVVDRLVQHVVFGTVAFAVGHVSEMVGTRDELHARIFHVCIVDG